MTDQKSGAPRDASKSVRTAMRTCSRACRFTTRAISMTRNAAFSAPIRMRKLLGGQGRTVWSLKPYGFIDSEEAPPTVDPSLWRQSRLNMHHGLFEVVPGVYQVRGFDIANMTLIEGDTGVIVVDCLTTIEGARVALDLYFEHRGRKPVSAVIFTHTHTDHWGGARGVIGEATDIPVIAPNLFMEWAVSENVIAGPAMMRRAHYQFGPFLAKGPRGHVDCGLGKTMAAGASRAGAADRSHHGDGRPPHDRRRRTSNSRWRRIPKRRRRCISSPRATSCSTSRRTARIISTTCCRFAARMCAMRWPGRAISARRCRCGAARPRPCAASTTGRYGARRASTR